MDMWVGRFKRRGIKVSLGEEECEKGDDKTIIITKIRRGVG